MPYTRVQSASNGATAASLTVTLGAAPTVGHLLIAFANADATVTNGGTGWTLGPTVVDGNGCYIWYKIAGAGEPSAVTFTPSVSDFICAGLVEYTGAFATAAGSLDKTGTATHTTTQVSTTGTVTTTPSSWNDLVIGLAALHDYPNTTADPTNPVWTGGLTNVIAQGSVGKTAKSVYSFYGDLLDAGQGVAPIGVNCSWSTQTMADCQMLVITFQAIVKDITIGAASTSTSTVNRSPGRTVAANATSAPTVQRTPARILTASSTSTAGAIRASTRALAAAATSTATAIRSPGRTVAATSASNATTTRGPGRTAAATATSIAATSRSLTRLLGAANTTIPALLRGPARNTTATATTAASTQREPGRNTNAATTTTAATNRSPGKLTQAAAATTAGTQRGITRVTNAATTTTGGVLRGIRRILAALGLTTATVTAHGNIVGPPVQMTFGPPAPAWQTQPPTSASPQFGPPGSAWILGTPHTQ